MPFPVFVLQQRDRERCGGINGGAIFPCSFFFFSWASGWKRVKHCKAVWVDRCSWLSFLFRFELFLPLCMQCIKTIAYRKTIRWEIFRCSSRFPFLQQIYFWRSNLPSLWPRSEVISIKGCIHRRIVLQHSKWSHFGCSASDVSALLADCPAWDQAAADICLMSWNPPISLFGQTDWCWGYFVFRSDDVSLLHRACASSNFF